MRVILLKDVAKLGKKDEVKEIKQGYALNFLIPQKLARAATDVDIKALEKRLEEKKIHEKISEELIYETIKSLDGKIVEIAEKANDNGHLFSKVHKNEIVDAIKNSTGLLIEEDWIILYDEIKEIGERELIIKSGKFKATVIISVKKA